MNNIYNMLEQSHINGYYGPVQNQKKICPTSLKKRNDWSRIMPEHEKQKSKSNHNYFMSKSIWPNMAE